SINTSLYLPPCGGFFIVILNPYIFVSDMLKYKDQLGQFITEDQAKKRGYFSKLYYIHNELKKEEIYFQNTIIGGAYYLSSNEDLIEVLNDLGHHLKWSIMSNQQIINGYTLWEART